MYFIKLDTEYQRLCTLENAVKNYGGGIERLIERVSFFNDNKTDLSTDVKLFLMDIERYLTDVAIAGQMGNEI